MQTCALAMDERGQMSDKPRSYSELAEPFMVTMRHQGKDEGSDVKVIWWYIAALDEGLVAGSGSGAGEQFTSEFFPLEEALEKLSFQNDRMVLQKAITLVNA